MPIDWVGVMLAGDREFLILLRRMLREQGIVYSNHKNEEFGPSLFFQIDRRDGKKFRLNAKAFVDHWMGRGRWQLEEIEGEEDVTIYVFSSKSTRVTNPSNPTNDWIIGAWVVEVRKDFAIYYFAPFTRRTDAEFFAKQWRGAVPGLKATAMEWPVPGLRPEHTRPAYEATGLLSGL